MSVGDPSQRGVDAALVGLGGLFLVASAFWIAGAAAAVACGHKVATGKPLAGLAAFAHPTDPGLAWGGPVGPAAVYWLLALGVVASIVTLAVCVVRLWRRLESAQRNDPLRLEGLASRTEVRRAAGQRALLHRAQTLRPSLTKPAPQEVGFRLGFSRGVSCWASVEDSATIIGPARSGKGLYLAVNAILDAPGAVVTTSSRADNFTATLLARQRLGPVAVFDPQGLVPGIPSETKWSPVRGCDDPETAMSRASALVSEPSRGVTDSSFWKEQCLIVVRALLHAAALDGRTARDLYQWSLAPAAAKTAVDILREHPQATVGWSRALDSVIDSDPRQRDSTWAMVANCFAALALPKVLDAVSPESGESFDPEVFIRSRGTVYMLGMAEGAVVTARLVAAFVQDLVDTARRLASVSPGARLDPPLALVLDEAANYPLDSLPALMSDGGGTGITTMAFFQSLAQARKEWGRDAAEAIWNTSTVKVVLGGHATADDLRDISTVMGTVNKRRRSVSYGGAMGTSSSWQEDEKPILTPSQVREMPHGVGLLMLRSSPPITLRMRPWTRRKDAKQLARDRALVEEQIRDGHDRLRSTSEGEVSSRG